jgi:hypothetical protein
VAHDAEEGETSMAADRGSYRAIPTVLLDGKDFHRLTERERWVFVALKINLGPAGIEVHYPRALAEQLAQQTGAGSATAVAAALDTLERDGWIQREGNVIWIVRQLEFEPNMKPADAKHRKSIQRHVAGLPRLTIVARFIAAYPDWFPAEEFTPPKGLTRACEGPSKAPATTEDRRPITEDRDKGANAPSSGQPDRGEVDQVFAHWVNRTGRPAHTKLTAKRRDRIIARLRSFSAGELVAAIDGLMLSDHHTQKPEWTDLVSCFGSDEKVENHIARGRSGNNGASKADLKLYQYRQRLESIDLNASRSVFDA